MGERLNGWLPRALPSLAGRAWWPFMAVWSAMFAVGLWSSAMVLPGIWQRVMSPVSPSNAVGFTINPGSTTLATIGSTSPRAAAAGLRHGDQLVLVNDKPAAFGGRALDRQLEGKAGTHVILVTASLSGATRRHVMVRDPRAYHQSLASVGLNPTMYRLLTGGFNFLFGEVLLLGCGLLLMITRSHDPLAPWASLMMLALLFGDSPAGEWFTDLFTNPTLVYYLTNGAAFSLLVSCCRFFRWGVSSRAGHSR